MHAYKSFTSNLHRAENRVAARPKEASYVKQYLPTITAHIQELVDANPEITAEQMEDKLFEEIENYSNTVYHNAFVFAQYMEYIACQFLKNNKNKYQEISEKLKDSNKDFENTNYQDCSTFEEYLLLYVYRLKKSIFLNVFEGYLDGSSENYINFDELLQENIKDLSSYFFEKNFNLSEFSDIFDNPSIDKQKKVKEFSTWYNNAIARQRFLKYAQLFLNGSFSCLAGDDKDTEKELRKDLAKSTSDIVEQLDRMGHIDEYLAFFVVQMCEMGFPEYASPVCKDGALNTKVLDYFNNSNTFFSLKKAHDLIDKNKFKQMLSEGALSNPKVISLESLLALNAFWSNRYIKELDLYSEAMFAVHDFNLINRILSGEKYSISKNDIKKMLIKMNTFYRPSTTFLEQMQEMFDHTKRDEKMISVSCDSFYDNLKDTFGNEYHEHFSRLCPASVNDLLEDARWYLNLYNPIFSSYGMKNETINALLSSINNSKSLDFPNAGIILEDISSDGTFANLKPSVLVGFDAKLSFPVRVHAINIDELIYFLKSLTGTSIMPIYEGANDFKNPLTGEACRAPIVLPLNSKYLDIIKKARKNLKQYKNPKLIAHLGFLDSKHPPEHLGTTVVNHRGKKETIFKRRYVDLETGIIYTMDEEALLQRVSNEKTEEAKNHGSE